MKRTLLAGFLVVALAGCGGGGGSSTPAPAPVPQTSSAEGMWNGTTSTGSKVTGFVLDDGTFYAVYTDPTGNYITGIIHGNGNSVNNVYTATNAIDYYFTGATVLNSMVSANFTSKQSFLGTVSYPSTGRTVTFSTNYDSRYDQAPSLATIAGTYSGSIVGGSSNSGVNSDSATVTISNTGIFSGTSTNGCSFSGSVAPRSNGNVYNVNIRMGAYPCLFANQTLNGMIFYGSDTKRAFAAAPTADRSGGFLFSGVRQ